MESIQPQKQDIDKLLAFLPRFEQPDFEPIEHWISRDERGNPTFGYPLYNEEVKAFFEAASKPCWMGRNYIPKEARAMLDNTETVASASLAELRTMLTFCVRRERFSDGFWGYSIREGMVQQLLRRLQVLREAMENADAGERDE